MPFPEQTRRVGYSEKLPCISTVASYGSPVLYERRVVIQRPDGAGVEPFTQLHTAPRGIRVGEVEPGRENTSGNLCSNAGSN